MANEISNEITRFNRLHDRLNRMNPDAFFSSHAFNSLDTTIAKREIGLVLSACKLMQSDVLSRLPRGMIIELGNHFDTLVKHLDTLARWTPYERSERINEDWNKRQNEIAAACHNTHRAIRDATQATLFDLLTDDGFVPKRLAAIDKRDSIVSSRLDAVDVAFDNAHQKEIASRQLLERIEAVAGLVAVSKHEKRFADNAKRHAWGSWFWLVCGVASLGGTGALAYLLLFDYVPSDSASIAIVTKQLVSRIFVVSLGVLVANWCSKNFRSHRHLNEINTQKAAALSTFQIFANEAPDDQTKSAVLTETTRAIFSVPETGYVSGDGDRSDHTIIEVLKHTASSKSG